MQSESDIEQHSQLAFSWVVKPIRQIGRSPAATDHQNKSLSDNIDHNALHIGSPPSSQVSLNKPPTGSRTLKRTLFDIEPCEVVNNDPHVPGSPGQRRRFAKDDEKFKIPGTFSHEMELRPKQNPKGWSVVKKDSTIESSYANTFQEATMSNITRGNLNAIENALPEDFVIPSPPSLSSGKDSEEVDKNNAVIDRTITNSKAEAEGQTIQVKKKEEKEYQPRSLWVTDSFYPPQSSQDSACFSYKREAKLVTIATCKVQDGAELLESRPASTEADSRRRAKDPYYSQAFCYVLKEVVTRYSDVLRSDEVNLATSLWKGLSREALALFVRIYRRRQPHWYSISGLNDSYRDEIDVDAGAMELFQHGYVESSLHEAKNSRRKMQYIAKELLEDLPLETLRAVSSAVPASKPLQRLSRRALLPALRTVFSNVHGRQLRKGKLKQTTLSGYSEADCLSKAIIKRAGHSIRIPEHLLEQLQRIHFLFFLEAGHDSAKVLLAQSGKVKFPDYECRRKNRVFSSTLAFEDYEAAILLEEKLNRAVEESDIEQVAYFGSIAELAVMESRRFLGVKDEAKKHLSLSSIRHPEVYACSSSRSALAGSIRSPRTKNFFRTDIQKQLEHPFFRRYTAQWVYVRTAWHSVAALEKLGEYESAVQRLRLLLSTGLMPKRRGACLNRLTINLYKHLGKPQEALNLIVDTLEAKSTTLRFGDRLALTNRGIAIHRQLRLPLAEEEKKKLYHKKSARKLAIDEDVRNSTPTILDQTLLQCQTNLRFRKVYGVSMQIANRERKNRRSKDTDHWERFRRAESRDSPARVPGPTASLMGKSKYVSHASIAEVSSVENYCLEWYVGKEGWSGVHDEGSSLRFLYALLLWECALFAPIDDVFQTPYQDYPLDLFTEAYYYSRRVEIDERISNISSWAPDEVCAEVKLLYSRYDSITAIGCAWKRYTAEDLSQIAAGLGGPVLSHCCKLFSVDYAYWSGGLPDLTLWKTNTSQPTNKFCTRLVEVKSPRDVLSERQKAWLLELHMLNADCEVCKVVEKITAKNAAELESSALNAIDRRRIDESITAADDNI